MVGGETVGRNSPSEFVVGYTHGPLGLAGGLVTGTINQDSGDHILWMADSKLYDSSVQILGPQAVRAGRRQV